ncbi:MAG: ATP-binding cassette domain-containing protein [Christensenellales bacterium]
MLQLKNIVKNYGQGDNVVHALKGVSLDFRESEFVAVLGQSGCGKTTMLNIIGGLDRYTEGDLVINGVSTEKYKDVDWDAYRNNRIGFIFQSYNLISHVSILANVEMALTLSGVGREERKRRALQALKDVGLEDKVNKRPNELSGGQMQRVSIARALVNNPDIILADEPTGALDSATSVQIMDILKEISKEKLVIMVTHNPELAQQYATRIVRLNDGVVVSDSNPFVYQYEEGEQEKSVKEKKKELKKTSMSFWTALKLSFNNLRTKKGRTIMTSIAGSIGIIGVALVLAISNGMQGYINKIERTVLAGYPIQIAKESFDTSKMMEMMMSPGGTTTNSRPQYPDEEVVYPYDPTANMKDLIKYNNITQEYVDYVAELEGENYVDSVTYSYGIDMNVIGKINKGYFGGTKQYDKVARTSTMADMMGSMMGGTKKADINWQEMMGDENYVLSQYQLLKGKFPTEKNQVVLVIDKSNQLSQSLLASLGMNYQTYQRISFDDLLNIKLKLVTNNAYYYYDETNGVYKVNDIQSLYNSADNTGIIDLEIVGILREKPDNMMPMLSTGIAYTAELTRYIMQDSLASDIVQAQKADMTKSVLTGVTIGEQQAQDILISIGGSAVPIGINIYPKDFDGKQKVIAYLDGWTGEKINYNDMSKFATDMMGSTVNIVSIALICFAAVSLLVSSVMIGVITYVSVVERTKEIGILRSLGARKTDILNVFNAETTIIGAVAGTIGVIVTYLLSIPINLIIGAKSGITTLCSLSPWHALMLIAISTLLTIIAGLIPSYTASKRDAVVALRTE